MLSVGAGVGLAHDNGRVKETHALCVSVRRDADNDKLHRTRLNRCVSPPPDTLPAPVHTLTLCTRIGFDGTRPPQAPDTVQLFASPKLAE